jgi:AmmeMemoRadiSam system protein B/AmmeMemoRadiSam system protein A
MNATAQPQLGPVRQPAVAGFFYPDDAAKLTAEVRKYLAEADAKIAAKPASVPKAIIAPHAGYVYSGLTAAAAYRTLAPARGIIKRVVMMGPCHRVAVRGLALPGAAVFRTPLGDVPVDQEAVSAIRALPGVEISDATHKDDHALEVHLPFLQVVLGDFKIVPMIVGGASPDDVARVLETLWGGPETLILISSDLSHYLPYDAARAIDDTTRQAIEQFDLEAFSDNSACGRHSIKGLLQVAQKKGLSVSTADVRNSGDTAGPKDRVVGYGSWLFHEPTKAPEAKKPRAVTVVHHPKVAPKPTPAKSETRALLDKHGTFLLQHAARSILVGLKAASAGSISIAPELAAKGAAFVTLQKAGRLRGCIGSIVAHQALIEDISQNAQKAAFHDPRFPSLTLDEINAGNIHIHISVLSPQTPMTFKNEADLLAQIRPHRDGLILQDQGRRGVFLPSVWEQLPDAKTFLNQLKRKAGLPETHWSDTVQVWRYVTEEVRSENLPAGVKLWTPA